MVNNEELVKGLLICSRYLRYYRYNHVTQDEIIKILGKYGGKLDQKAIQDKLGIRSSSTSELIAKDEQKGLIMREKDGSDKRKLNITLTDEGRKLYKQFVDAGDEYNQLFSVLSEGEKTIFSEILQKLGNEWMSIEPEAGEFPTYHHDGERK